MELVIHDFSIFYLLLSIYFSILSKCFAFCLCLCTTLMCLQSLKKGIGSPRTGVKGVCELPVGAGNCT